MASIEKRDKKWRVFVAKKGVRLSATFDTKSQAQAWATLKEAEILSESTTPIAQRRTFADALVKFRDEVSPTHKGGAWEAVRINKLLRHPISSLMLCDLTTAKLAAWRDEQLKVLSPSSVKREMNIIGSVLNYARREWQWITDNPLSDVRKPTASRPRDRRISDDELLRLRVALSFERDDLPVTLKKQQVMVAFLLAIETAMRCGEILGLTWDNVNLAGRFVTLKDTKNGDKRNVPLSLYAIELLQKMQAMAEQTADTESDGVNIGVKTSVNSVFTVQANTLSTLFRVARDAAGIKDLHFHDSRHEAITRLAKKLPILDLARMIGHRDLKSLMIYYNATATEIATMLD